MGLPVTVVVVADDVSDNADGMATVDRACHKCQRLTKIWHDTGERLATVLW